MSLDLARSREQGNRFLDYARRFFDFGDQPDLITIILPRVERNRPSSLKCQNYPLYPYEMAPDDVFTALRLYSMLVLLYGDKVQVEPSKELRAKPLGHRILIGGAPTNIFSFDALKDQYYRFGANDSHSIVSLDGRVYSAELDGDETAPASDRWVIRDYAIISKQSRRDNFEFLLSGSRAYGQMALWYILRDMEFYKRVLPQVEGRDFQILIQVAVNGRTCTSWDVLDIRPSTISEPPVGISGPSVRETVTWLHLSDLHFRDGSEYNSKIVMDALLRDIERQSHGGGLHPDFVALTGDIAFSGNAVEYKQAGKFFDDLLSIVGLPKDRLFVVPGNHDVDRLAISSDPISVGATSILNNRDKVNQFLINRASCHLVFQRLTNYAQFVNEYFGTDLVFDDDNYFYTRILTIGRKRIAILGLNSAWLCGSDKDRDDGLLIGERQARTALDRGKDVDIRIALVHHPFDWLKDFDRRDSGELLLSGCDFILHGHLRQTGIRQLKSPDSGAMIISAGATYDAREYPNSYNFVRLNTEPGKVILRRYSDVSPGFWASDTLTYENATDGTYTFHYQATRKR